MEQFHYWFPKLSEQRSRKEHKLWPLIPRGKCLQIFISKNYEQKLWPLTPGEGRVSLLVPPNHRFRHRTGKLWQPQQSAMLLFIEFCKKRISFCHTIHVILHYYHNNKIGIGRKLSLKLLQQNISNRDSKIVRNCPLWKSCRVAWVDLSLLKMAWIGSSLKYIFGGYSL